MKLVLIALLLMLSAWPVAIAAGDCNIAASSLSDPLVSQTWNALMAKRAASGLQPFTWSDSLAKSSAWMARDNAQRNTYQSTIDSLGRDPRTRDTDCGYRSDAQVGESAYWTYQISNGGSVYNLWYGNGPNMYSITYSYSGFPPVYTVGAIARYRASNGMDFWVLDVGTDNQQATPTSTPIQVATPTLVPTSTPEPTPEPIPQPVTLEGHNCEITRGTVDSIFDFLCRG